MKQLSYIIPFFLILLGMEITPSHAQAPEPAAWPMVAANAQRTSWTPEEVRGDLSVEWYRTIEPFVQIKTQVIAAEDKLFISTARGLYAFDAADGAHLWTYGTQLPLGHSPTYANGILYVGGYDRRIHAIDASNGTLKSGWSFVEAGAGFETNPLVINGRVYAGNRDGYFYCLDANNGSLIWKWRDDSDEYPNAPIRQSAAYKDGVFYFGSDNSHAYAIRDNGGSAALVWKSDMLPGVGFSTYWPVVYTEPSSGKEYVLFSGTKKEVGWVWFGDSYFEENYDIFAGIPTGGLIGPTGSVPGDWVSGTRTIDASEIQEYFNQKPHKRHLFVLDAASGVEHSVFAPVSWVSATHGGSKQPPVIGGDGVLYTHMGYKNGDPGLEPNAGASGGIAGWKFGTQYISQVYDFVRGYADEPVAFSAGGNLIYWVEGFNMGYGAFEIDKPYGANASWEYSSCGGIWGCLGTPGYDEMMKPCEVYGSCNGVYSGGGSGFYPYKGRVYLLERNALIAFGPASGANRWPTLGVTAPGVPESSVLPANELSQRLEAEVSKMLAAGHLRPGFHDSGLWGQAANGAYAPYVEGDHLAEYFHNPGDTVTSLLLALPYLSPSLQTQVKSYIQDNYGPGATYDFTQIAHIGWKNGAQREIFTDTPERAALMSRAFDDPNSNIATVPRSYSQWNGEFEAWKFPQTSFYAAWKYAQVFPDQAATVFNALKNKLEPTSSNPSYPTDAQFNQYPYVLNAYIAAYRGYMELETLAGDISSINQSARWNEYNRLLDLRVNNFSKDSYITDDAFTYEKTMNVARNFMYLVPELADELRARAGAEVQAALTEYNDVEPYWFVSKFDQTYGEGVYQPLYDYNALFLAKAYILEEPYDELVKYLDVPAFYRGDLFYIQNLVAALAVPPDTSLLTVSVTKPADGAVVSGTVTITADAAGDVAVAGVQFQLDGASLGVEDTVPPYTAVWDSTSVTDGAYQLTAVAQDGAGNTTTSSPVSVTVDNFVDTTPPTVTGVTPAVGATDVALDAVTTVTFSEAMDPATIDTTTFELRDPGNNLVAVAVSYDRASQTASLTPSTALANDTQYTATVRGGTVDPRVKDVDGNALVSDYTWSFTTVAGPRANCPCSLWDDTDTPANPSANDKEAVEVGVKFQSDVDGYITGIRFYKGVDNTGTHIGNLWSSDGTLLATATFANETASGWQQVNLATPVAITANTTYVASYHTEVGNYAVDQNYFGNTGVDSPPLRALADGVDGGNGVYQYGPTGFPASTYQSLNYWVDVVFATTVAPTQPQPLRRHTCPFAFRPWCLE